MKCHCCAWLVDLNRHLPFLTLYAAVSFTCPMTLMLTAYSSCWSLGLAYSEARTPMSSYAAAHPGYSSFLYASRNALGSDGCVLVAMAPRDASVITEAKFFSA